MELLTKTGEFTPYGEDEATKSHLEVYKLSEDTLDLTELDGLPADEVMEKLGFSNKRGIVEPGAWYTEYNFILLNGITGILIIEVRESLNV